MFVSYKTSNKSNVQRKKNEKTINKTQRTNEEINCANKQQFSISFLLLLKFTSKRFGYGKKINHNNICCTCYVNKLQNWPYYTKIFFKQLRTLTDITWDKDVITV